MAASYDVSKKAPFTPSTCWNRSLGALQRGISRRATPDESGNPRYVTASDLFRLDARLDPSRQHRAYMMAPYIVGATEFNAGEAMLRRLAFGDRRLYL